MNLAREPGFRLGGLDVRPATREVVHAGGREVLEPRVMSVLVTLVRAKGEVVTRDDLSAACWEGRVVSDDAINRVLSRIRKVSELTEGRDFTLETITKVGYRLVALGAVEAPGVTAPEPAGGTAPPSWRRVWVVAAAVVVAALVGVGVWRMTPPRAMAMEDPTESLTLAVLPFDNLSVGEADNVLALGMSREIRNTLSRVRGLRVVSDASSFALAAEPMTALAMSKRLMADLLLDGSLERNGDTVRLSVELVDGWAGVNVWTGSQSGPAAELDRLRQQLAAAVFEQIVVRIGPNRIERLAEPRSGDPRFYRSLVEADQLLQQAANERLRGNGKVALEMGARADALVAQALAIDPETPMGLLLKARIIAGSWTPELFAKQPSTYEKQAAAAEYLRRALVSDPDYAPALGALGEYYRRFEWRWSTAGTMLERALALDPNQADVRISYSYFLSGVGRCVEALEHAQAAVAIDPEFGWRTFGVPRALKCLGQFDKAEAAYLDVLRQDPDNVVALREIYLSHLARRDVDGLGKVRDKLRDDLWQGKPPAYAQEWLGWTGTAMDAMRTPSPEFSAALEEGARRSVSDGAPNDIPLANLLRGKGDMMWVIAMEFAFTGQTERALELLKAAVEAGTLYIPETMPFGQYEFTPEMRADPRYQAIWRNDPRLVELLELRRKAVAQRQMAGVDPDGTVVVPALAVDIRS